MSSVSGLHGVTARIHELEARVSGLRSATAAPVRGTGGTGSTASGVAFATELQRAAAQQAPAGGSTALRGGVPVDLAAYGNGKIPASALSPIGGGHRLWAPAAASFDRMQAAAARDGVTIRVTDSYRSYEQQVDVARRKGLYSQGGLAAKPGTSDHGWGRSLDLDLDSRAQNWMRANAGRYGFAENVPREPWHWTFSTP